jgi:hypothetical protein
MRKDFLDLTGRTFGRLTVLKYVGKNNWGQSRWLCRCTCDKEIIVAGTKLLSCCTKSCGCLSPDITAARSRTHGMSGTPEYIAYNDAKERCTKTNDKEWKRYGGRGIKFLFTSFEQFFAELGPRPEGKLKTGKARYSLDRYPNNDGHYEPGNVRDRTGTSRQSTTTILLRRTAMSGLFDEAMQSAEGKAADAQPGDVRWGIVIGAQHRIPYLVVQCSRCEKSKHLFNADEQSAFDHCGRRDLIPADVLEKFQASLSAYQASKGSGGVAWINSFAGELQKPECAGWGVPQPEWTPPFVSDADLVSVKMKASGEIKRLPSLSARHLVNIGAASPA